MQLDLFQERRGPAVIVRFPLVRRKGFVSATARELAIRDHDAGRSFWRTHLRKVRSDLKAIGYSQKEIASEVEWYTAAVSHETLILLSYRNGWPNDAA